VAVFLFCAQGGGGGGDNVVFCGFSFTFDAKTQARAACLLRQLCETVKSVHSQKWIHHDISLSNIIVEQRQLADDDNNNNNFNNNSFGSNSTVQLRTHLVDFGLAQYSHSDAALLDSYGATPFFSAPELLNRKPHRGSPVRVFGCLLLCCW
jgi:serine/threonine protein kinase